MAYGCTPLDEVLADNRIFLKSIKVSGLLDTLSAGSYTIFAPTDVALKEALKKAGSTVKKALANVVELRKAVKYLVVDGGMMKADLPEILTTLRDPEPGCPVTITVQVGCCFPIGWMVGHGIRQLLRSTESL